MKNNLITVSVIIPAYNAEQNILRLINSILIQKQTNYLLKNLIVHSDCSTDTTDSIVQKIKSKLLTFHVSQKRIGFAGSIIKYINTLNSDLLIFLNDDIIIKDPSFIDSIVTNYIDDTRIGLMCANLNPLPEDNFFQRAEIIGYKAYQQLGQSLDSGNNVFTVDGKVLILSQEFVKKLRRYINNDNLGNVDSYLYFSVLKEKLCYKFVQNSSVFFKMPVTLKDFVHWQIRNIRNKSVIKEKFQKNVIREYSKGKKEFNRIRIFLFLRYPIESILIYIVGKYCEFIAKKENSIPLVWYSISTTKELRNV